MEGGRGEERRKGGGGGREEEEGKCQDLFRLLGA